MTPLADMFGGFGLGVQSIKVVTAEQKSFINHRLKPTGLHLRQGFTVLPWFCLGEAS